jgi:hypothetical protein
MDLVDCPACGLPAEVLHHFTLPSTTGPAHHVKLRCISGHVLTPLAERLGIPSILRDARLHARAGRFADERAA